MSKRSNNEGTIFERKGRLRVDGTREPNRWVAELTIQTPDGPKRKVMYAQSQREAKQLLEDAKLARAQGRISAVTHQTVGGFLDTWLATVRSSVRPTTYASYDLNVRRFTRYLERQDLASLAPADIQQWYVGLQAQGLSPHSIAQARRTLHIALEDAVRWELINRNPVDATKAPRTPHVEKQWLQTKQIRCLFDATKEHRLHALWLTLVTTGLRIGEALALDWDDFDSDQRTLEVRRALQRQTGKGLVFVETKTEKSRRTVALPEFTAEALVQHKARQDEHRRLLGPNWRGINLIFCTDDGAPLDGTNVYRTFRHILETNGLPKVGLHALRHSAASLMLEQDVPLKVVQQILGHSSYHLTANTYSHVTRELQRKAAKLIDEKFRGNADNHKGIE